MFLPRRLVSEDLIGEAASLAHLADADDARHEGEIGVDQAEPLALRAGALRVGAEQRGLHLVGRCERLANRIEDAGVRRRVGSARAADGRLVDDRHRWIGPRHAAVDEGALAGAGDAGDRDQHAGRHVDRDVLQVVERRVADRDRAARRARRRLQLLLLLEVPAGRACPRRRGRRTSPRRRSRRRASRPAAPCRRRDRRSASPPARARRRGRCCPCRAAAEGARSSAARRAHGGRSWARRRRRSHRSGRNRGGGPSSCAAPPRQTAWTTRDPG